VDKSWIACALGHKACRDGRTVLYQRVPRLFEALALARGDGRHARLLKTLARTHLLILDDWGLQVLTQAQHIDLLEILEDRNGRGSTLVTSQVPIDQWCDVIGDPTLADAIFDRFVHNAHRLNLTGDSMLQRHAQPVQRSAMPVNNLPHALGKGEEKRDFKFRQILWKPFPTKVLSKRRVHDSVLLERAYTTYEKGRET
jgi:hypothetical protein